MLYTSAAAAAASAAAAPPLSVERDVHPLFELSNKVDRVVWSACIWSPNGEFIVASSRCNEEIYIWNIAGQLVKILEERSSRGTVALAWNPRQVSCLVFLPLQCSRILLTV